MIEAIIFIMFLGIVFHYLVKFLVAFAIKDCCKCSSKK